MAAARIAGYGVQVAIVATIRVRHKCHRWVWFKRRIIILREREGLVSLLGV